MISADILTYLALIICVISLFLLGYLWYKFWEFRHHFLISARFPKVTIFISILMFMSAFIGSFVTLILNFCDCDFDPEKAVSYSMAYPVFISIINILAFMFCGGIILRSLLIYDTWSKTDYTLQHKSSIIQSDFRITMNKQNDHDEQKKYIFKFCGVNLVFFHRSWMITVGAVFLFLFIIILICAPSLTIKSMEPLRNLFTVPFVLLIIIGIIILFKSRKIKESVLFIRETYLIILIILLQIISSALRSVFEPYIRYFIGSVLALIGTFFIMVFPLWIVYKNEGSLDLNLMRRIIEDQQNISTELEESHKNKQKKSKAIMPLYQYLNKGPENYNEFATFLSTCFALENLLFFAKVLVFRHVLLDIIKKQKPQNKEKETESVKVDIDEEKEENNNNDKWCPSRSMKKVFALKFDYLDGLYQIMINGAPTKADDDNLAIHYIAASIFNQYISTSSINEVNISAYNRDLLTHFFADNNNENNHEIEEYLKIFNGAIEEIHALLNSVYSFQFKSNRRFSN